MVLGGGAFIMSEVRLLMSEVPLYAQLYEVRLLMSEVPLYAHPTECLATTFPSNHSNVTGRTDPSPRTGNRERPGSPGCHEESEARMVKVNVLTLSASPRRLN